MTATNVDKKLSQRILYTLRQYNGAKTVDAKLDMIMFVATLSAAGNISDDGLKQAIIRLAQTTVGGGIAR